MTIFNSVASGGTAKLRVLLYLAASTLGIQAAHATPYTVLYNFTNGADGYGPTSVVQDANGNLFATVGNGGVDGVGTVIELSPTGNETTLHSFTGGSDGGSPNGGLIADGAGNLYGTTNTDGINWGTVFEIPSGGALKTIYGFPYGTGGANPTAGVILGNQGELYGTTFSAGADKKGIVYEIAKDGTEIPLHAFAGGSDGASPFGGVVEDSAGNLYGTTYSGGSANAGTVFKIEPNGKETVLYTFTGGNDGAHPFASPILDTDGNLYGTTYGGGVDGAGVVFEVTRRGKETVLHSFTGGSDGAGPESPVIFYGNRLYGTTSGGGAYNAGTVYSVTHGGIERVLHSFGRGRDGKYPGFGLTLGSSGGTTYLYGAAGQGGTHNAGVIFRIKP